MFEKPWFTTFLSTTTCSCCLLLLRMGFGSSFGRSVEVPQAAATDNDTLRPAVRHRSYSRQGAYSGGPLGKSTIPEEDGQDSLHAPLLGDGQADGNEDSLGRQVKIALAPSLSLPLLAPSELRT